MQHSTQKQYHVQFGWYRWIVRIPADTSTTYNLLHNSVDWCSVFITLVLSGLDKPCSSALDMCSRQHQVQTIYDVESYFATTQQSNTWYTHLIHSWWRAVAVRWVSWSVVALFRAVTLLAVPMAFSLKALTVLRRGPLCPIWKWLTNHTHPSDVYRCNTSQETIQMNGVRFIWRYPRERFDKPTSTTLAILTINNSIIPTS